MEVVCPRCGLRMLWTSQDGTVTVRCVNREMTSWIGKPPRKQQAVAIYATTNRTVCWHETYWIDGEDRVPSWYCGKVFNVLRRRSN